MNRVLRAMVMMLPLFGAENPWAKVRDLKSGQEVRIVKRESRMPIIGVFDELTDENLIVVVKKEQVAVPKDSIERIDARPAQKGPRLKPETRTTTKDPEAPRGIPNENRTPTTNSSTNLTLGEKPDFETVYRRTAASTAPAR